MAAEDDHLDKQPPDGELAAIERQCFERPWKAADYERLRSNPQVLAWVLRGSQGAPHGMVCFQIVAGEVEIFRIGVVPSQRRMGLGRTLVQEVVEYAAGEGAFRVTLEVRAGNSTARHLYNSLGFRQVGTREGYFQNPREDALIFGINTGSERPDG